MTAPIRHAAGRILPNWQDREARAKVLGAFEDGRGPSDEAFDAFLPDDARAVSDRYWSPVRVAVQAAVWFDELGTRTVVDIGAGVGKFCVAAALAGHRSRRFIGLEHRPRLVETARRLATQFGVEARVQFSEGAFADAPVPEADAYYLFNPFGENVFCAGDPLDRSVELTAGRLVRDVGRMQALMRQAPLGTAVVTYHGFGGTMGAGYEALRAAGVWPHILRLWQKKS